MFFKKKKNKKSQSYIDDAERMVKEKLIPNPINIDMDVAFCQYNFDMMYELGQLGIVMTKLLIGENGKLVYNCSLPFEYKTKDKDGKLYTHHSAAVEGKEIIKKYRLLCSNVVENLVAETLFKKDDEFYFSYKIRDDVWDDERRNKYTLAIKEEADRVMNYYNKFATESKMENK